MNRSFNVAVLTVTMLIMMSTGAYALTGVHNFTCDGCHGKFMGSGERLAQASGSASATNSCITCHSSSGEASRLPVNSDSMANYFGTVPGQQEIGPRSSHTFLLTTTLYRAKSIKANTLEPTVNTNGFNGTSPHNSVNMQKQVLCVRCHYAAANTNATKNVDKPFLRASNLNDALCLDCHRNRVPVDNTIANYVGSHPVSKNGSLRSYSSVYKSNTTAFRKRPVSPNINNPTAKLGNYFNTTDKVVCSTCHAVHYGDSNSATLDNRSTANGFAQDDIAKGLKGQMQNSKGQLLRTDPVGATAASINVCSSCHKETANMNHNAKGQNVQCDHCHSAHVDYTGDGSLPNYKLVRRDFSNISTDGKNLIGQNKKVIYNTATSLRFQRADSNGICQICHTPTPGVAIHDVADTRAEDCITCHKHSNGFSAADCTSCHGQPPITSLVGGPNGKASAAYTIDESMTPHATHADKAYYNYACKNCHYDGTRLDSHKTATATFQSVFVDTAGSVGVTAGKPANVPGDYNPSTRVCSNVYCHSNGSPRGLAYTTVATPSWEYGRNKILGTSTECSSCHGIDASLTTNAHIKHVATYAMKCNVCHAATANTNNAITDRSKHANGTKDVKFATRPTNFFGVFSTSWNSVDASCNNSCHSNGLGGAPAEKPVWTQPTTGDCGSCHAAVATTSLHPFHFTGVNGPKLGSNPDCASCHVYSTGAVTHANGMVDLKAGNSCAPCHQGTTPPIWATGVKVTCESCHTGTASVVGAYTASLKDLNKTAGHGQYSTASLNAKKCTNCHDATKNHIGAGPTEKRLLTATSNALCSSCHTAASGKGLPADKVDFPVHGGSVDKFTHYTSALNVSNINAMRASECSGCHDTHGTTNLHNIRTTINGQTVAYSGSTPVFVVTTAPYNGLCQVCHTKTKYYNAGVPFVAHNLTTNCLSCHTHKGDGVKYAFMPVNGACGSCHGYPPVKSMAGLGTLTNYSHAKLNDYTGGGGAHSVKGHISRTAVESEAWANCTNCHNNASHMTGGTVVNQVNVNVMVDPKFKFNNATSIVYNANTCSNVSCHFKPSPNWVTGQ